MSSYGHGDLAGDVPALTYSADHRVHSEASWQPFMSRATRRHWVMAGNQRIQLLAASDRGLGLLAETHGLGCITCPLPWETGVSVVGTGGEVPWVLILVRLRATKPASFQHVQQWAVRPRFTSLGSIPVLRTAQARRGVRFSAEGAPRRQGAGSRCWSSAPTSARPRATPVSCGSGSASTTARRPGALPRACAL
jgi:hypothetical protein